MFEELGRFELDLSWGHMLVSGLTSSSTAGRSRTQLTSRPTQIREVDIAYAGESCNRAQLQTQ